MKNTILIIIFSIILGKHVSAQNNSPKEIIYFIKTSSAITNPDSAQLLLDKAVKIITEKEVHDSIKALFYHQQGNLFLDKDRFNLADSFYNMAEKIYFNLNDTIKEILILNSKANLNSKKGKFIKAKSIYEKSLNLARLVDSKVNIGRITYNLGNNYANLGEYEKAITFTTNAANIFKELHYDKEFIMANQDLALTISKFDANKSIKLLNNLFKNKILDSFPKLKIINYANLGVFYGKLNKPDSALSNLKIALNLSKKFHLIYRETRLYGSIANTYLIKKDFNNSS